MAKNDKIKVIGFLVAVFSYNGNLGSQGDMIEEKKSTIDNKEAKEYKSDGCCGCCCKGKEGK